jgi:hypothetical protein
MARALITMVAILAMVSSARAGERRRDNDRLRLATTSVFHLLGAPLQTEPRPLGELGAVDDTSGTVALAPFVTLLIPPPRSRADESDGTGPLLAVGARVQGRTLVAFTRPGARTDPDDRVVYQRLVASDLFEGRRFSVTVYEDHALGPSSSQILGFGARLLLRPSIELLGWRTRVELFASYDLTQGATGYLALVAHSPTSRPPAPTAFDAR